MSYVLSAARRSIRTMFRQRDRGHRLTIVATLAVTLGASAAIFAVVNAVWLKPLPFADPSTLHVLWHVYPGLAVPQERVDAPGFAFYQRAETPFIELAAVAPARSVNVAGGSDGDPVAARQVAITPNFFRVFGVPLSRGRMFTKEDVPRGAPPVAVVSAAVWSRHFGDVPVSGQKLYVDGEAVTIVGVLPRGFQVLERSDIWRPLWLSPRALAPSQIGNEFLTVFGRARRDTTPAAMAAGMARLTAAFREAYPAAHLIDPRWHVAAEPLRDEMLGGIAPLVPLLLASVAVLVVVGFVNVANLVLAQSVARRHDAAVKTAIGSTRARLVADYAAEALVLAGTSAALGLVLARTLLHGTLAVVLDPADLELPPWNQVGIDGAVAAFAAAIALLGALVCAVVPSWTSRGAPVAALGGAGRSTLGRGQRRLLNGLVTLEVATASLLVVASGLLVQSILRLSRVDPGFDAAGVGAFELVLPQRRYPNPVSVRTFQLRLMEQLRSTPGIESAGFVSALPFRHPAAGAVVSVEGREAAGQGQPLQSTFVVTGSDYFRALRIPLRRGRLFGAQDGAGSTPVVVLDEAAARHFWPDGDPVGRRLQFTFEDDTSGQPVWREVVGVVGQVRTQQLRASTDFQFYVPAEQMAARNVTYVVRVAPSAGDLAAAVRGAVAAVDPDLPLHDFQGMPAIVAESFALLRAAVAVVTAFGSMAAVLTGIGVYGVISYLVALRRPELGVKLALGATAGRIRGEVLQWALTLAVTGLVLAVPAALALSWSIRSLLFDISPFNPLIQAGAAAVILTLVVLASYGPATAAARIDPVQTLRQG